jgi:hypothetical protein
MSRAPVLLVLSLPVLAALATSGAAGEPTHPPPVRYEAVAAIFERACMHCHGGARPVEGLSLASYERVSKGGASGPVVVPGKVDESTLVGRLRGRIEPAMPLDDDPLPEADIAQIEAWIREGARPPEDPPAPPPAAPAPPAEGPVLWSHVEPVLRAACVRCHQDRGLRGAAPEGIRFDAYAATVGGRRVAVIPGRPEASPLVRAVEGRTRKRMPLDGPPWLEPGEVALLTRWVKEGARGADGAPAPMPVGREVRLFGTFDGAGRLDGVPLSFEGRERREERIGAGAFVEVRARVGEGGVLHVERIRARE